MKLSVAFFASILLLGGCATTYEAPIQGSESYSIAHNSSKEAVIENARRVLLLEGFQIQSSQEGFISTSLKNWRLSPEQASCGTTMGLDYLKDKRTKTEVSINVIVGANDLTIRSNIQGEYKPGAAVQDITLTCVSKGIIEHELIRKIVARPPANLQ